jgi:hypothetical protein
VRVTYAGGGPPSTNKLGDVSTSSGNLYEPKGQMFLARLIGKWSYRCTYLGRLGQRGITHACSWEHTITGRAKIVVAGGLRWDSNAEQWFSITRVTGSFKGYTGVERQVNFNSDVTSGAFYLVKG